MKFKRFIRFEHYDDETLFRKIDEHLYQTLRDYEDVNAGGYVTAMEFTFEHENEQEDAPYLLEDILDRYNTFAPYSEVKDGVFIVEFAIHEYLKEMREKGLIDGEDESLPEIRRLMNALNGKRVYWKTVTEDGKEYLQLIIE